MGPDATALMTASEARKVEIENMSEVGQGTVVPEVESTMCDYVDSAGPAQAEHTGLYTNNMRPAWPWEPCSAFLIINLH